MVGSGCRGGFRWEFRFHAPSVDDGKSEEGFASGLEEMASARSDLCESGHIANKGAHWEEVVGSDVGELVVL